MDAPMSQWTYSLCIPTVPRPEGHCARLLARLVETGTLTHPQVRGLHVACEDGNGPNETAARALFAAVDDMADWIVFLEDDIDIIDDLIGSTDRWLREFHRTEILFYPLGCNARRAMRAASAAGQRAWNYPIEEFYGACGLVFSTGAAALFLTETWRKPEWMMPWCGLDENLKRWHQLVYPNQPHLVTPVPSFIDHLGAVSSIDKSQSHFTGRYPVVADRSFRYGAQKG